MSARGTDRSGRGGPARHLRAALALGVLLAVTAAAPASAQPRWVLVASGLAGPVAATAPAGDAGRLFVVERAGRIRIVRDGVLLGRPFLDLTGKVSSGGERGLLGLAFHPRYAENGRFFVDYTDLAGNTVVAEFRVSADPDLADPSSARTVLTQVQPFANHNGGNLAFSPLDGTLYVGLGDGGSGGDPLNNSQNDGTWLGKMLRVDVDRQDAGKGYAVPPDNPFAGRTLPLPEIWAKGLRNPWRYAFDRRTGDLWIGDVGQDLWEEVDFQPAGSPGGENYGWRLMEGTHCYLPSSGCNPQGLLTLPVLDYAHGGSASRCSATGGVVVRAPRVPEAAGRYLFGDFCSGEVFSASLRGGVVEDLRNETAGWAPGGGRPIGQVASFGEDADGEVYLCDFSDGEVYRLETTAPSAERVVPIVLDATGRFGSRFSTELTLLNAGTSRADVTLTYVPAAVLGASGGGRASTSLGAGEERTLPDVLAWLRSRGLPIPTEGAQGGTLRLSFTGLSSAPDAMAVSRTTTPAGPGRAGLATDAPRAGDLFTERAHVFGLRETAADRSNLALLNAGTTGTVTLRVTLVAAGRRVVLPETYTLGPGAWTQLDSVLARAGLSNGWAVVERVAGTAPFSAYAAFNDNVTNDGSYVPAVLPVRPSEPQVVPAVVETPAFESEVVLANPTDGPVTAELVYVESLSASAGARFETTEPLAAGEQRLLPSFLDTLRRRGAGLGGRGGRYAGSLFVTFRRPDGRLAPGFAGARTAAAAATGGAYGLFTPGVGLSATAFHEAWLPGLRQDGTVRTNLALVNAEPDGAPLILAYELFDAATGLRVAQSAPLTLPPGRWLQVDSVLRDVVLREGYAKVSRLSGSGRFLAYAVVNDGGTPGAGTDDGSYVAMERPR